MESSLMSVCHAMACPLLFTTIHCAELHRALNELQDLNAEDLRQVNVGSWFSNSRGFDTSEYHGESIPTLEQLLDELSANKALLYLELKCSTRQISETVTVTCRILENHSVRERVIVECFDLSAIEEVKRIAPESKTAALFEPNLRNPGSLLSGRGLVERAKAAGADEIALHYRLANKKTVEAAREAGLKVIVWTVDDPNWLARAREFGIDGLITNDPALLISHRTKARAV